MFLKNATANNNLKPGQWGRDWWAWQGWLGRTAVSCYWAEMTAAIANWKHQGEAVGWKAGVASEPCLDSTAMAIAHQVQKGGG